MDSQRKIVSVDVISHDTLMIYLADGSILQVTADQLLNLDTPRYPVPDNEGFRAAVRKALN